MAVAISCGRTVHPQRRRAFVLKLAWQRRARSSRPLTSRRGHRSPISPGERLRDEGKLETNDRTELPWRAKQRPEQRRDPIPPAPRTSRIRRMRVELRIDLGRGGLFSRDHHLPDSATAADEWTPMVQHGEAVGALHGYGRRQAPSAASSDSFDRSRSAENSRGTSLAARHVRFSLAGEDTARIRRPAEPRRRIDSREPAEGPRARRGGRLANPNLVPASPWQQRTAEREDLCALGQRLRRSGRPAQGGAHGQDTGCGTTTNERDARLATAERYAHAASRLRQVLAERRATPGHSDDERSPWPPCTDVTHDSETSEPSLRWFLHALLARSCCRLRCFARWPATCEQAYSPPGRRRGRASRQGTRGKCGAVARPPAPSGLPQPRRARRRRVSTNWAAMSRCIGSRQLALSRCRDPGPQPSATCTSGKSSLLAAWVGSAGFSGKEQPRLEQRAPTPRLQSSGHANLLGPGMRWFSRSTGETGVTARPGGQACRPRSPCRRACGRCDTQSHHEQALTPPSGSRNTTFLGRLDPSRRVLQARRSRPGARRQCARLRPHGKNIRAPKN